MKPVRESTPLALIDKSYIEFPLLGVVVHDVGFDIQNSAYN